MDVQNRTPSPVAAGELYYWTNTYYYDNSLPAIGGTHTGLIQQFNKLVHASVVIDQSYQLTTPPHSGLSPVIVESSHVSGLLDYNGDYTLYNIVRLAMLADGDYVGYKLLRCCAGVQYITSGMWDEGMCATIESAAYDYLLRARLCTDDGLAITDFQVRRRVSYWGLRMGSRRSTRVVIPLS